MSHRPPVPITNPVHVRPYPPFPNVVIAFPDFVDWESLYDPGLERGSQWRHEMYAQDKGRHERKVTEQLDAIAGRFTGRAVLEEISSVSSFPSLSSFWSLLSVRILPYNFLPQREWRPRTVA